MKELNKYKSTEDKSMAREQAVIKKLIEDNTLKALSETAGVDETKVRKVLAETLPQIMQGVEKDAKENGEALEQALGEHAEHDVSDPAEFLKNADVKDGERYSAIFWERKRKACKRARPRSRACPMPKRR